MLVPLCHLREHVEAGAGDAGGTPRRPILAAFILVLAVVLAPLVVVGSGHTSGGDNGDGRRAESEALCAMTHTVTARLSRKSEIGGDLAVLDDHLRERV